MNRFLKHWRLTGRGEAFRAHVVSYADDFVILSRGHADEALAWTKAVMTKLGLTLNEAKTSVRDARHGALRLPWLHVRAAPLPQGRPLVPGREPVQEERAADQGRRSANSWCRATRAPWPEVRDRLNRLLRGWSAYFGYGTRASAYRAVDDHVYDRVRNFLVRRHKVQGRGTDQFSRDTCLRRAWRADASDACVGCRRRGPCDEASRKAGCGKSARPV